MRGIGGISNKDYDDFYSIGLEALYDSSKRFDESKSQFQTFLIGNIKRKFKTEIRDRHGGICFFQPTLHENGRHSRKKSRAERIYYPHDYFFNAEYYVRAFSIGF